MTAAEMITHMENMENGQRIDFLLYLYEKHFKVWRPSEDEVAVLRAFHEGDLEGIDLDEYRY